MNANPASDPNTFAGDADGVPGPSDPRAALRLERGASALPARVPWRSVIVFIVISFTAAWAVCLPLWLGGRSLTALGAGMFQVLAIGMMFTPALAALIVVFFVQRPSNPGRYLGLVFRPAGRTILFIVIGVFTPILLFVLGMLLAGALGLVSLDSSFEGLRGMFVTQLTAVGATDAATSFQQLPIETILLITVAQIFTSAIPLTAIATFGEELGWRGWLLPSLRPLGTWPAIALSSVIWSLWHAPLILLGYNFGDTGPLGLVMMTGSCFALGAFLSWLRLRSASVYPAVLAHSAVNSTAAIILAAMAAPGTTPDPIAVLPGWTSWIPLLLLAAVLVAVGQFRKQPLPGLTLAESAVALDLDARGTTR